jgi:hypothetical protein
VAEPAAAPAVAEPTPAAPAAEDPTPEGAKNIPREDYERAHKALKLGAEDGLDLLALDEERHLVLSAPQAGGPMPASIPLALLKGDEVLARGDAAPLFASAPPELLGALKECGEWGVSIDQLAGGGGALLALTCAQESEKTYESRQLVMLLRWEEAPRDLTKLRPAWIGEGEEQRRQGARCMVGSRARFRLEEGTLRRTRAGFAQWQAQPDDDAEALKEEKARCVAPEDKQDEFSL